jgi:hypothetical protein
LGVTALSVVRRCGRPLIPLVRARPWTTWCLAPCQADAVSTGPVCSAAGPTAPQPRAGWPYPSTGLASLSWQASVPCARRSTGVCPQSMSTCATAGWPSPHGRSGIGSSATTHGSPSHSLILPAGRASPQPRAASSWPWMAANLTLALRCCGACGTASPGKSSWPAVCCPRPNPTAPYCAGPCVKTCRCRRGGMARCATPVVPLSFPPRGSPAPRGRGPPCPESTQQACAGGAPHRTAPRRTE